MSRSANSRMQFTFAAEAQAALEKGVDAKALTDDRSLNLLGIAKAQAAANLANGPRRWPPPMPRPRATI